MPATTQATLIKLLQESDGALMEVETMDSLVSDLYKGEFNSTYKYDGGESGILNDIDSLCDRAIAHLKAVKRITRGI